MSLTIDLKNLPTRGKFIDWKNTIGYKVPFNYNNIIGELEIIGYIPGKHPKMIVDYENNKYELYTESFYKALLSKIFNPRTSEFKVEIGSEIINEHQSLKVIDKDKRPYSNGLMRKYYLLECSTCKRQFWKEESNLVTKKTGCPYCNHSGKREIGFNDIPTVAPWMISYFPGGEKEARNYTPAETTSVYMVCPKCGRKTTKKKNINSLYYSHTIGCPCELKMSVPEVIMYNILELCNINFIYQPTNVYFKWANKYRYDFYLPDFNCIIETHGAQHYRECSFGKRTLTEEQENDKIKRELAIANGIKYYYEIDCSRAYLIKPMLENCKNSGLFDLLNIENTDFNFNSILERHSSQEEFEKFKILINDETKSKSDIMTELNINAYKYQKYYSRCEVIVNRKHKKNKNVVGMAAT